ncbi:MAG: ankyrin repeat domain-containing protein [Rickettsia endosymbiont of Ecitomorpha arachnoides]|nr:ankyrin repeat domain-containing protein [Rickettsia endosymbiont of Ecitomorpha arachnoides]
MKKQQIPTLSTSALDKSPGPDSPDSDIEMKSTSVKSDIDELAKLLKDKTKDGIAIFNSALKVCIENNPNALLHEAAEHGKKKLVIEILKVNRDSINSTTPQGLSVLHSAVAGGNNKKEIIEILLNEEPILVTKKDASGLTPSCYNTSKEILKILQEYERNIMDFLIKKPKFVPITPPKCLPTEFNLEKAFEEYMGCKLVGQTNPKNSDEF